MTTRKSGQSEKPWLEGLAGPKVLRARPQKMWDLDVLTDEQQAELQREVDVFEELRKTYAKEKKLKKSDN